MSREMQVTFDCADPAGLAAFWAEALGYVPDDPPSGFATTAKDRQHLDVRAAPGLAGEERMAALEAECDRLVALGATRVERHEPGGISSGHLVMLDPEGHEFCLD